MDNLDKIYKKTFDNFERKPKRDLWVGLEQRIPPKPNPPKKRRIIFWSFTSAFLAAFLLLFGYYIGHLNASKTIVRSLPIPFENQNLTGKSKLKIEQAHYSLKDINISKKPLLHQKEYGLNKDKFVNIQKNNSLKNQSVTPTFSNETSFKITPLTKKELGKERLRLPENISPNKVPAYTIPKQNTENQESKEMADFKDFDTTELPFLATKRIEPIKNNNPFKNLFKRKKKIRKKKKTVLSDKGYLAIQYSPLSMGQFKIKNPSLGSEEIRNANIQKTVGLAFDVGLIVKNNLVVQLGLSSHQYNLTYNSIHFLPTSLGGATIVENDFIQKYRFEKDIGIENVEGTITIKSRKGDFENGDPFSFKTKSNQTLKLVSFSNQIGYRFTRGIRWEIIPRIGFNATRAEKGMIEKLELEVLDNRLNLVNTTLANTNVSKVYYFEGLLSTEVAYHFRKNIYFTATPQYRYGFNPFYESFQKNLKNRTAQLNLGIRIHL